MNATETRAVLERNFDLMGRGEDFAVCYADDVSWTTFDGGTMVVGPTNVRDYVVELHTNMPEGEGRPLVCADGTAYLEGDFPDPRSPTHDRIAWCLAYDIADGLITAGRLYGALGFLVPAPRHCKGFRSVSEGDLYAKPNDRHGQLHGMNHLVERHLARVQCRMVRPLACRDLPGKDSNSRAVPVHEGQLMVVMVGDGFLGGAQFSGLR